MGRKMIWGRQEALRSKGPLSVGPPIGGGQCREGAAAQSAWDLCSLCSPNEVACLSLLSGVQSLLPWALRDKLGQHMSKCRSQN